MILTTEQAIEAIETIQKRTKWKLNKIAFKAGISSSGISKLMKGGTENLNEKTRESLEELYDFVIENTEPA